MTQEIEIKVRLKVASTKTKEEIKRLFFDIDLHYTTTFGRAGRKSFHEIGIVQVEGQSETYCNEYVNVLLTLQVDAEKDKEQIKKFFDDMEQSYTIAASSRNRWEFTEIRIIKIREEAEIYGTIK